MSFSNIDDAISFPLRIVLLKDTEFELRLMGTMDDVWFEGEPALVQPIVSLLNIALGEDQAVQQPGSWPGNEAGRDFLNRLAAGKIIVPAVQLTPVEVSDEERQRWLTLLEWEEIDELEEGPLRFFRFTEDGSGDGVVMPIEALEECHNDWAYDYNLWLQDHGRIRAWQEQCRAAVAAMEQAPLKPLADLEVWAAAVEPLDPKSEETHHQWAELDTALGRAGLLDPPSARFLPQELRSQGFPVLARWRTAALAVYAHALAVPGLFLPGYQHAIAAMIGLHWFRLGPFHSDNQDVIHYMRYALQHVLDREPTQASSCLIVATGGLFSGTFFYASGAGGLSQLYLSGQAVNEDNEFTDGRRLDEVAARMSRAGYSEAARTVAAFAVLREPNNHQHWVELGMTLWYPGRQAEGIACMEHAAELDSVFGRSRFLAEKREQSPPPVDLPADPGRHYFDEALTEAVKTWPTLPAEFQLALVWLNSLFKEPALRPVWRAVAATTNDLFLRLRIEKEVLKN
ncbi:MAG: hypothetical protein QNJ45_13860 [Ardenticatenaceae bacterium]|nr:hypothetical protein [Ardenticatenaceae bacterium]